MYLISDKFNSMEQAEGFIESRHDQSIFSLLSKKRGCISIENETHFSSDPTRQYEYPFLSVRTYGHGLKDKLKFKINYQKKYDLPVFFEWHFMKKDIKTFVPAAGLATRLGGIPKFLLPVSDRQTLIGFHIDNLKKIKNNEI